MRAILITYSIVAALVFAYLVAHPKPIDPPYCPPDPTECN